MKGKGVGKGAAEKTPLRPCATNCLEGYRCLCKSSPPEKEAGGNSVFVVSFQRLSLEILTRPTQTALCSKPWGSRNGWHKAASEAQQNSNVNTAAGVHAEIRILGQFLPQRCKEHEFLPRDRCVLLSSLRRRVRCSRFASCSSRRQVAQGMPTLDTAQQCEFLRRAKCACSRICCRLGGALPAAER